MHQIRIVVRDTVVVIRRSTLKVGVESFAGKLDLQVDAGFEQVGKAKITAQLGCADDGLIWLRLPVGDVFDTQAMEP